MSGLLRAVVHVAVSALGALLFLVPATLAAPPSHGAYYSLGGNGESTDYVNRNFIILNRGLKFAFLTTVYASPRTMQGVASPYVMTNVGMEFDCDQPRFQLVGVTLFDDAGNTLANQEAQLAWSAISPGGTAERVRNLACGLTAWPEGPFASGSLADLRQAYLRAASGSPRRSP